MSIFRIIKSILHHIPGYYRVVNFVCNRENWRVLMANDVYRHFCFHEHPRYDKKYNISICGIFKNEASFLREWITYHEIIGVEHFWLYNNNSSDNYQEILQPFIDRGLVTLIDWPYDQGQISAYHDFYEHYRHQTQWYTFLDIDEFFVPKYEMSLLDWLKHSGLDRFPALLIYWRMFGTSGKMHHNYEKLVIEQYHACWEHLYNVGKCLINSDYEIAEFNAATHHLPLMIVHCLGQKILIRPFNMYGRSVCFINDERTEDDSKRTIQINHYWSKAWDIYDKKRKMTDVYFKDNPKQNMSYFYRHEDKNISTDYTITKFIIRLKLKLSGERK